MANSPEYERAHAEATRASAEFRGVQTAYRTKKIGTPEYMAGRQKYDASTKAFDAAYAKEAGYEMPSGLKVPSEHG